MIEASRSPPSNNQELLKRPALVAPGLQRVPCPVHAIHFPQKIQCACRYASMPWLCLSHANVVLWNVGCASHFLLSLPASVADAVTVWIKMAAATPPVSLVQQERLWYLGHFENVYAFLERVSNLYALFLLLVDPCLHSNSSRADFVGDLSR